ncbi:hypothetical protein ACWEQL_32940 [Kitasatospora sp. NPDC004240]
MSATCPQCAAPDQSVALPQVLEDAVQPLDKPTRALLAPPPRPQAAKGGTPEGAVAFFAASGLSLLLGVAKLLSGGESLERNGVAYQMGYRSGWFLLAGVLLLIGLAVRSNAKDKAKESAEELPAKEAQWELHHRVWQDGWLCRRCRVAFFPEGAIRPDYPASPAIPVEQFPVWVTTAAERAFGTDEPATPADKA